MDTNRLPTAAMVVSEVQRKWESYRMPGSEPLRRSWGAEAGAFLEGIVGFSDLETRKRIRPICAPLGAGKSLTMQIFAGMLSGLEGEDHPGGLIVVSMQKEAESVADFINKLAKKRGYKGREYAAAYHSSIDKARRDHKPRPLPALKYHDSEHGVTKAGTPVQVPELAHYKVLVICHQALENCFRDLGRRGSMTEAQRALHSYLDGDRKWICVDEILNLQLEISLPGMDLASARGAFEFWKKAADFPVEMAAIEDTLARHKGESGTVYPDPLGRPGKAKPNFKVMRKAFLDSSVPKAKRLEVAATLEALAGIYDSWSWVTDTADDRGKNTLTTAAALIPDSAVGFTLLDGTSHENPVLSMLANADPAVRVEGCRLFRNFTLSLAFVGSVSTSHTMKVIDRRVPAFIKAIQRGIESTPEAGAPAERKVLLVDRKEIAEYIRGTNWLPESWALVHYGGEGAQGSNDYRDFTDIGVINFPYLPEQDAPNSIMTHVKAKRSTEFFLSPEGRIEVRLHQHRKLICEIAQAIGRISVRKVENEEGDCPKCHAWVLAPDDDDNKWTQGSGNAVAYGLIDHFEGLQTNATWEADTEFDKAQAAEKAPKKGPGDKLVDYLLGMPPGARVFASDCEAGTLGFTLSQQAFSRLSARIWKRDQAAPIPDLVSTGIYTDRAKGTGPPRVYICKH